MCCGEHLLSNVTFFFAREEYNFSTYQHSSKLMSSVGLNSPRAKLKIFMVKKLYYYLDIPIMKIRISFTT